MFPKDKVLGLELRLNEKYYHPQRIGAVDEIMLLFKGRFRYRQHVRGKPKATGLKIYGLSGSTNYLWSFFLYRGRTQSIAKTVWSLVTTPPFYAILGYLIIADSYFGGFDLALLCMLEGAFLSYQVVAATTSLFFGESALFWLLFKKE
jgi:hypothetical protein